MSLPRVPTDRGTARRLTARVLYGGSLVTAERTSDSWFHYVLELPRPLRAGERHEYAMSFQVPANQPMRTHYVYTPPYRCDRFDLRIRFGHQDFPTRVWRVTEAFMRTVDDGQPTDDLLVPDDAGEVSLRFHDLQPGFGYGVQWTPPSGANCTG